MLDCELFDGPLAHLVEVEELIDWDDKAGRIVAQRRKKVGALLLGARKLTTVNADSRRRILLDVLRRQGLELLPWTNSLRQWQARVMLLRREADGNGETPWPDVSDAGLLASVPQWLLPWLDTVDSLKQLRKIDLAGLLQNLLPWPLSQQLDVLAPRRIDVPSGSSIAIDYCQQPPVLAVKLQEMFGCDATPAVANGRVKLLLHLLSPAGRPLQVTQDLAGFWRSSYPQVKKEMKGRYPKHPWPDDPLTALPTRHVKRRSD
jgi:ATP-dependent helicase HrpB